MTNLERFRLALDGMLTWDFVDNEAVLTRHAGCDRGKTYAFHDLIPVRNVETLYRTAHRHGTYPIDVDRIRSRRRVIRDRLSVRAAAQELRRRV